MDERNLTLPFPGPFIVPTYTNRGAERLKQMSVSFRRIVQATALAVPLAIVSPQLPAMAADSPDPVVAEAQCDQGTVAHSAMKRCVKHAADLLAQTNKHNQGTTPAPAPA